MESDDQNRVQMDLNDPARVPFKEQEPSETFELLLCFVKLSV